MTVTLQLLRFFWRPGGYKVHSVQIWGENWSQARTGYPYPNFILIELKRQTS